MDNGFLAQAGMQTMFMRKGAEQFSVSLLCCPANLVGFSAYLTFSKARVRCLTALKCCTEQWRTNQVQKCQ